MKVVENPSQLSLETRGNMLLQVLAVLLLLIAFVIGSGLAKRTTLACTREGAGLCTITEDRLLGGHTVVRFPLRLLTSAEAAPARLNRKSSFTRLYLDIDDGHQPYVFTWYGDRVQAQADAQRIREYVQNPQDVFLRIEADKRPLFWSIAGVLGALGLLLLTFGSQSLTIGFDGATRQVAVESRNLFHRRERTYSLDAVKAFHVGGLRHDNGLFMELSSGERVPLSISSDPEAFGGPRRLRARHQATAEKLTAFTSAQAAPGAV